MHNVFISYSTQDIEQAQTVRRVLENNQITCWMAPTDIPGGSNYTKEIPIAIRGCQVFLLVLSQSAQNSQWVLKELDSAVNAGKIILPFMLEDCILNDEFNFLLSGAQRYAAYQRKAEALEKLIGRIKAIIQTEDHSSEPQSEPALVPVAAAVPQPKAAPVKEKVDLLSDDLRCPACNSYDVAEKKTTGHPADALERIALIVVPLVMAFVTPVAVLFLLVVLSVIFDFMFGLLDTLIPFVMIGSAFGGGFGGLRLVRGWVHRRHIRKHIRVCACRCNTCAKKFTTVVRTSL